MDDRTAEVIKELRAEIRRLRKRIEQLENENRRLRSMISARQLSPIGSGRA